MVKANSRSGAGCTSPFPEELRKAAFRRIPQEQIMATEGDAAKLDALIAAKVKGLLAEDAAEVAKAGPRFRLAHLTGTTHFNLSDTEQQELKRYIDTGGTLVIDVAGASTTFAESAEALLVALFGKDDVSKRLASPLPLSDSLYTQRGATIDRSTTAILPASS